MEVSRRPWLAYGLFGAQPHEAFLLGYFNARGRFVRSCYGTSYARFKKLDR